jgi:hypothetical protein
MKIIFVAIIAFSQNTYTLKQESYWTTWFRRSPLNIPTFSKKPAMSGQKTQPPAFNGFLLDLLIGPEDGSNVFLKKSVDFYQTTCQYNPEDCTLHNHSCWNLKSRYTFTGVQLHYLFTE